MGGSHAGGKGWKMTEIGYKDEVLKYLQTHGMMTDLDGREYIGTNKTSEYVRRLREDGYKIRTEWRTSKNRFGRKVRHGVYIYGGK